VEVPSGLYIIIGVNDGVELPPDDPPDEPDDEADGVEAGGCPPEKPPARYCAPVIVAQFVAILFPSLLVPLPLFC